MVENARRAGRSWLRPRRLLAVAALCVLLGLGLIAFGWFPQERVRLLVEKRMREAIGPRSRVGAVSIAPGPPPKRGKGGKNGKGGKEAAPRVPADVMLPVPDEGSWDAVIDDLAASLPALAGVAGKEPRS